MILHRFNTDGVRAFEQFLMRLADNPEMAIDRHLLEESELAEPIRPTLRLQDGTFANRMEAAAYLDELLQTAGLFDVQREVGIWTWLTLYYFDQVCPPDREQRRSVGQMAKWVPQTSEARRYYRHCLLGPYLAYRAHRDEPERARVLLSDPMHVTTSEVFRIFIESTFINMKAPVAVASKLYFDKSAQKLRRGAGVKGPGGLRRFLAVLQQLDVTFDLHCVDENRLIALLPMEFEKWL